VPTREIVFPGRVQVPGTPDGAILLQNGGMSAVQVVRSTLTPGRNGVAYLLHTLLVKVYKSLRWLLDLGPIGETVATFTIACWVPTRLSTKALGSLGQMLKQVGDIDRRFEFLLLVPPTKECSKTIFPMKFGKRHICTGPCPCLDPDAEAKRGSSTLLRSIRGYSALLLEDNGGDENEDLGFLGLLLRSE